jgi:RimJ/RimL family protein N-acetyltransferase
MDKRHIFFEGRHVLLTVPTEADVEESNWVGWFNDEELCRHNQHHYFPNTLERQREHFRHVNTPTKIQLGIRDREDPSVLCGFVSLQSIDLLHRRAEIAGFQDQRLTGSRPVLFLESWSIMIRHGFNALNLHKICGGSFHPHAAATLKRVFGFEVEGTQRQHVFKDGAFRDVTLMAVFRDTIRYPEI